MSKYIKTSEVIAVENYPYGFKLRTTLTDSMEFNAKKGYRHVTQTVNPKNGALNKPKKSTYYALLVRFYDENGHIKSTSFDFNGDKAINSGCKFLAENFDLFTAEEISYLTTHILLMTKVGIKAGVIYAGSTFEDLKPLYDGAIKTLVNISKTGVNEFANIVLDIEAIKATQPKDFNPFRTTQTL